MISRRTLIGAMAALPGAAALQQATADPEASPLVPDLARAPASPAAPVRDPLIDAIDRLRAAFDDFTRNAPLDNQGRDAYATASYGPPLDVLNAWDQPAVSKEGALAALRLAEEENREFACSPVAENMVSAALAYFEGDVATVARVETPPPSNLDAKIVRLHKLHREASQLMDAYNERAGGRWELRVRAADDAYPVTFMNLSQSVQADLARYHLEEYKRAVQAADPTITAWRRCTPEDDGDVAFWLMAMRS